MEGRGSAKVLRRGSCSRIARISGRGQIAPDHRNWMTYLSTTATAAGGSPVFAPRPSSGQSSRTSRKSTLINRPSGPACSSGYAPWVTRQNESCETSQTATGTFYSLGPSWNGPFGTRLSPTWSPIPHRERRGSQNENLKASNWKQPRFGTSYAVGAGASIEETTGAIGLPNL